MNFKVDASKCFLVICSKNKCFNNYIFQASLNSVYESCCTVPDKKKNLMTSYLSQILVLTNQIVQYKSGFLVTEPDKIAEVTFQIFSQRKNELFISLGIRCLSVCCQLLCILIFSCKTTQTNGTKLGGNDHREEEI